MNVLDTAKHATECRPTLLKNDRGGKNLGERSEDRWCGQGTRRGWDIVCHHWDAVFMVVTARRILNCLSLSDLSQQHLSLSVTSESLSRENRVSCVVFDFLDQRPDVQAAGKGREEVSVLSLSDHTVAQVLLSCVSYCRLLLMGISHS